MRIGAGGGGSSKSPRVYVSKSRIGPPQGLVLRQRLEEGGELRPAVASRQRQPQRLEVAADRLQLPDELARGIVIEAVACAPAKLLEADERRPRVWGQLRGLGLEHLTRELASLVQVPRAAQDGHELDRCVGGGGELVVRHFRDRLDRQPPDPRQVVVDVVLRQPQLLEVTAYRRGRNPLLAQRGDGRAWRALGELAPVLPQNQAVMD